MTIARSEQIDLNVTPYYHCITRCVRRSFLCGINLETGNNFNHRKKWIVARIKFLSKLFAIKICAYAVMSNHYHIVFFVDNSAATKWSEEEVKSRWSKLFWRDAQSIEQASSYSKSLEEKIALWRNRLSDISWFMRCLNEYIARRANKEDKCKGRFWEGRFKCQALLDEGALLTAMAYVELNPIRAKVAKTPESSEFTSIFERIKKIIKISAISNFAGPLPQPNLLMPFTTHSKESYETTLSFSLTDYLTLVDEMGRIINEEKRGAIPSNIAPILHRLQLNAAHWFNMLSGLENKFAYAIGNIENMAHFNSHCKTKKIKGMKIAKLSYIPLAA